MENINIPIYRAEVQDNKLNFDKIEQFTELINGKRYAIGLLNGKGRHIEVTKGDTTTFLIIDSTTLAIHFPDMLDSQGNKIFASLSEDGKGGDKFRYYYNKEDYVLIFEKNGTVAKNIIDNTDYCCVESLIQFDNIGIQE